MSAPSTMQWIRQAAQRVSTGSGRLATHLAARTVQRARRVWHGITSWLGEGEGVGWLLRLALLLAVAAVLRKVAVAVAGGLYAAVADGRAPWLMWGAAGVWVVAAYRCGRDGWEPRPAAPEPSAAADETQPGAAAEQAPAGPPAPTAAELVTAVRTIGTPHAQLVPLAEHLGTTTDAVRAAAVALGWPVKDVRMKGRSSAAGLRADEAPPLPSPAPSRGVVGAGQCADDNDDTGEQEPREGIDVRRTDGGLIIYDLADRHRRRGVVGL